MSRRAATAPLQAFVLHQYAWSETSLIVELFTRERGRVAVVAKGAKRPYSQLRPVLLPFQRLWIQLGKPSADEATEIHLLRTAEWAGGAPVMGGGALFSGFYANELLLKGLARQDAHEALFDTYAATLPVLGLGTDAEAAAALRALELRLLLDAGWLPELDCVTLTRAALAADRRYTLHAETGVIEGGADALSGAALAAAQEALAHQDLPALQAACRHHAGAWRAQLRGLLQYHLGTGELRTRRVMRELQRLSEPSAAEPTEPPR